MDTGHFYDATSEQVQNWAFHNSLGSDQPHQLIFIAETFKDLDLTVFEKAVQMLVRRHESLRTCFRVLDGVVKQFVVPYNSELFSPVVYDISSFEGNRNAFIKEKINQCAGSLNKLQEPPLFRCCIFKIPGNEYCIHILLHHLIADVWGASVVYKELPLFYEALMTGKPVSLEPLKMQLRDYAAWQKTWLQENGGAVRQYWARKLNHLKDTFSFERLYEQYRYLANDPVACKGRKTAMSAEELLTCLNAGRAASYSCCLPLPEYTRLTQLSWHCKSSIWAVMNASLQLLFFLLTGKEKILIAMPVINRSIPGTETLIGSLGGGVYIQQPVQEESTVREFVQKGYLDFLESARHLIFDHREMQLNGKALRLNCDVFANFITKDVMRKNKLDNGMHGKHQAMEGSEYYALSSVVSEYEDGLLCTWKFNLDIFCPDLIEWMAKIQLTLLQAMCQHSQLTIRDIKCIISDKIHAKNSQEYTPDLQRPSYTP